MRSTLTGKAETGAAVTLMTCDLANHLTGIDATGTVKELYSPPVDTSLFPPTLGFPRPCGMMHEEW